MTKPISKEKKPVLKRTLYILDQRRSSNRYRLISEQLAKKLTGNVIILRQWSIFNEPRTSELYKFVKGLKQLEFFG